VAEAIDQPISVTVQHSPILKVEELPQDGRVEVPAGTTAGAVLERLGIPSQQQRYLIIYANGRKQPLSYTLRQDDTLQLFLPIGGG
jgi:sulfur carrier protein ThiS